MTSPYNSTGPFAGDWSVQLIVGDKRVNITMSAKGAMIVIIALKGEELHKAGLPASLYCRSDVRDPAPLGPRGAGS